MATKLIGVFAILLLLLKLTGAEECNESEATTPSGSCISKSSGVKTGTALYYTGPFIRLDGGPATACFGDDPNQFPANQNFGAGADGGANIWNDGKNCGKWFRIKCIGGGCISSTTISVKIVDHCPDGCLGRAFVISVTAFKVIGGPYASDITVEYSGPFDSA